MAESNSNKILYTDYENENNYDTNNLKNQSSVRYRNDRIHNDDARNRNFDLKPFDRNWNDRYKSFTKGTNQRQGYENIDNSRNSFSFRNNNNNRNSNESVFHSKNSKKFNYKNEFKNDGDCRDLNNRDFDRDDRDDRFQRNNDSRKLYQGNHYKNNNFNINNDCRNKDRMENKFNRSSNSRNNFRDSNNYNNTNQHERPLDRFDSRTHFSNANGQDNTHQNNARKLLNNFSKQTVKEIPKNSSFKEEEHPIDKKNLNQRELMTLELTDEKYECLICCTNIRKDSSTWCCGSCYNIYHLSCIKKWANKSIDEPDKSNNDFRCPTCQTEFDFYEESFTYRCFCNKEKNPRSDRFNTPHSCGEICNRPNKMDCECPHPCMLLCHPGPCPPCEATLFKRCYCGKVNMSFKCNKAEKSCVNICEKFLNCGIHKCDKPCHAGECEKCEVLIEKICFCDRKCRIEVKCGSEEALENYVCGNVCGKLLECMNHKCDDFCHEGKCQPCQMLPETNIWCHCGKHEAESLGTRRLSCKDPIPSCGKLCKKIYEKCGHPCQQICHEGDCNPCPLSQTLRCRCKKSTLNNVKCKDIEIGAPLCKQKCNKKLNCKRHPCTIQCCDEEIHLCFEKCGRMLGCKTHKCESECGHRRLCGSCPNVCFDELSCECGSETSLPPIACGQLPPSCKNKCSRNHECDHEVRHNCHSKPSCPPCVELISKSCPGGHQILNNIPCFRPVVTCGLPCGKPLPHCDHLCNRLCHEGDCSQVQCKQGCLKPRDDCGHPCNYPCHLDECKPRMTKCQFPVVVKCKCEATSTTVSCSKLQNTFSFLALNNLDNKEGFLGVYIADKGGNIRTACTVKCKTATTRKTLKLSFI